MGDYYRVLGVDRNASREALRRAYRSQILAIHPDRNPDDALATQRAQEVIEAYHALSNPARSRDCDRCAGYHADLAVQVTSPEPVSLQWFPRLMMILLFFAVVSALAYGVVIGIGAHRMVFRPQLAAEVVPPDPASPSILGRPIPKSDMTIAREALSNPAGNVVGLVCLRTALYAENQAHSGIRMIAEVRPSSL